LRRTPANSYNTPSVPAYDNLIFDHPAQRVNLLSTSIDRLQDPLQNLQFFIDLISNPVSEAKKVNYLHRIDAIISVFSNEIKNLKEIDQSYELVKILPIIYSSNRTKNISNTDSTSNSSLTNSVVSTLDLTQEEFVVFIISENLSEAQSLSELIKMQGYVVKIFPCPEAFTKYHEKSFVGCILVNMGSQEYDVINFIKQLDTKNSLLPCVLLCSHTDLNTTINTIKAGVSNILEKPFKTDILLKIISLLYQDYKDFHSSGKITNHQVGQSNLTNREKQILNLVMAGYPSKNIAADLGVSQRTVENHRAAIMKKTKCRSIVALVRHMMEVH
jgi:FixJ family two-component response regulator